MIVICFDYGIKTIGVAISETKIKYATPIKSIVNKKKTLWKNIDSIIQYWKPKYIIIGYPYYIKKKINKKIKKFSHFFEKKFNKNVILYNENYSSIEAKTFLKKRKKRNFPCIHSISAKIILDSWLRENYIF
ncbi:Putative pre-16S rRNA nuclease [Buchnera aphidicola (Cinara pseudotaxifoliae)]|uniref:Putative pre-16S rRNA nuclease n=1 Tax=Buchnera aphidicola (Cinara pseudotaxifoliae) TaxID=655384 RepID=A0A451DHV2_9GAMM|nr:Holliday junction resolvase RuvX [Buchnera aphidicola]VFP86233.1 Putative pre-16S rRNA nuclease [Buchnera aphidicola (Cinara pseudotaxifoliae)]